MPAASTTLRMLAVSVIASLTVTGCQTLDDAGRAIGRSDLVNDLAARLDRALELDYTASYRTMGGDPATIAQAQDPPRSLYGHKDGIIAVTAEATTVCVESPDGPPVCTLTAPPVNTSKPSVAVFAEAKRRGVVTPPVVIGLLTTAALDPDAVIEQSDTTLAGRPATCVKVSGAAETSPFTACVTTEGVLGSFSGEVDGKPAELALSGFSDTVDGSAFEPPPGARVIDRRPLSS